jgi:aminoglycoside phosphotransferase family enzyme/predicted kinase
MHTPLPSAIANFQQALGASLIETHISWVLLDQSHAYKIKKPITLPFLDYGSVEKRRHCCAEELRLNRRYAPDLYLEVIDIPGSDESAVKMRRFDEAGRLDHLCQRGELLPEHLSSLAHRLVAFHRKAAIADRASHFGEPGQILAAALENFVELYDLLSDERPRLQQLQAWTRSEFARRRSLMAARKQEGHIRECHGDLHLGNLVLLDKHVVPFDCIEFNDEFRWIDVASELAFTYVDLLDHRQAGLADWLLNEWLQLSGDFSAIPLLRFYAVYRAMVRSKVAAITGDTALAGEYLNLAENLIAPPVPQLSITFGLSGSGKTTRSSAMLLADRTATTIRLRSDIERKRLYGLDAEDSSHSAIGAGIYSEDAGARTYERLAALAASMLADGWSVIVDATFLRHSERARFRSLAQSLALPFAIIGCHAAIDVLQQRVGRRRNDASEATQAVLASQIERLEVLDDDELLELVEEDERITRLLPMPPQEEQLTVA